jgi:RHS repeat-associated protein
MMMIPQSRTGISNGYAVKESGYRFTFNGMEKDDEVKGVGNSLDFGARIYDSRLGRFLSIDKLFKESAFQSPYVFAGNSPTYCIDKNGNFRLPSNDALRVAGFTELEITRFTNIVNNISNIVANNPEALKTISLVTGLSEAKILSDMQPNSGPTIEISESINGSYGNKDGIKWSATLVRSLGAISSQDVSTLADQTLGTALMLLHEYGHHGDEITNDGKNSGEFSGGKFNADIPAIAKGNIKFGAQPTKVPGGYKTSITGERGQDITVLGFGIEVSLSPQFNSWLVTNPSTIPGGSKKPNNVSLPTNMQGTEILNTLNVE